jgi:tRNA-dihydrouridine synthase
MTAAAPILWLAPLKGLTDAGFRRTFAEHFGGFDRAMAPFITAVPAERLTDKHMRDLLPGADGTIPLTPQILGNAPAPFIDLAARLHDLGYTEVNWNLGCPFRPVSKKRRGAGLLAFPEAIDEFLERTMPGLSTALSIKMRLGRTTADEILKLLPILDRYPLSEIVIHPRTARQMYGGRPDLETFGRCLTLSRHRIVYNGDITDVPGFRTLQARFPQVGSWMIGRGALSDPFLPAAIKDRLPPRADKVRRFKAFYDDLFERTRERLCGPGHLLDRMKGYWTYFAATFTDGAVLAKQVHRTFQLPRYIDTVEHFFQEKAVWREDPTPSREETAS